jgi:hypothetical protein
MTARVTQKLVDDGTAPTLVAATASDTYEVGNGKNTFLYVKNGSAGSVNVTIVVPGNTTYGQPTPDPIIAVAAGAERWIPLRKEYADAENAGVGRCTVTTSAQDPALVTAAVQVG